MNFTSIHNRIEYVFNYILLSTLSRSQYLFILENIELKQFHRNLFSITPLNSMESFVITDVISRAARLILNINFYKYVID